MSRNWKLLPPLRRGLLTSRSREFAALAAIDQQWRERIQGQQGFARRRTDVVISLTSHARRFSTLAPTLRSLLLQTVEPKAVVLWISHLDYPGLPDEVLALRDHGLTIECCDDLGPHTKYAHALRLHPEIAICDDDTYYPPDWLAGLVDARRPGIIPCYRIHRIALGADHLPLAYRCWNHDSPIRDYSPLNFPTGVGGVLLKRENFDPVVLDTDLARSLSPTADDVWLYFTARLAGTRFWLIGAHRPLTIWGGSQYSALWKHNVLEHGNDASMAAVLGHFGPGRIFVHKSPTMVA